MYNLEQIGFYTLSDQRVKTVSVKSPLQRCELALTDQCNFKCSYCRGLRQEAQGFLPFKTAKNTVKYWISEGLKNIRFTGGEPLLYPELLELVNICRIGGVKRIAVSSNGSMPLHQYEDLIQAGVNDFSISLDACCAQMGDKIAHAPKTFNKVIETIKFIGQRTYITIGIVFTEENIKECKEIIYFADSLNPSDIRVIPSAQYNQVLIQLKDLSQEILAKYPVLRYRINNLKAGRHIRGITEKDTSRCFLVLDDMASAGEFHFPCIIYFREGGAPIGKIGPETRQERLKWSRDHNTYNDPICKANCLDCLVDYNNAVYDYDEKKHLISLKSQLDEEINQITVQF